MLLLEHYQAASFIAAQQVLGGGFSPFDVSAITAWLRLADGTITGSGYSSVPDKYASNPAVQGTDANRPPNLNSANALPRADFDGTADHLLWPAAANNNGTSFWGFAAWVEPDVVTAGIRGFLCATPGASNKIEVIRSAADLLVDVYHSQFVSRRGAVAAALSAATKVFLTTEFAADGANEAAQLTITLNASAQTVTFSDSSGTPGAMPAALPTASGNITIGCRNSGGVTGFLDGKIGPNIWILGSRMAGATQGLLTTSARNALMNFERPT